jgi:hypothetical protein
MLYREDFLADRVQKLWLGVRNAFLNWAMEMEAA